MTFINIRLSTTSEKATFWQLSLEIQSFWGTLDGEGPAWRADSHLGPGPYWHEMLLFSSTELRGVNLFHVPLPTRRSCLEMAWGFQRLSQEKDLSLDFHQTFSLTLQDWVLGILFSLGKTSFYEDSPKG